MIDIVKAVQDKDPGLGTRVIVLRTDSRALAGPDRLDEAAQAWIDAQAPGARFTQVSVLLAPYPGAVPAERVVPVLAFAEARHLAAFAAAWTADPEPEEEQAAG